MREIFQFVENKGKFFIRTTETLNKMYKNFNVKILQVQQNLKNFEKFARNRQSIFRTICKTSVKETKIFTVLFINRKSLVFLEKFCRKF